MEDSISTTTPKILCVNSRCYPTQFGWPGTDLTGNDIEGWLEDAPTVRVVLVEGEVGDYAAYCGLGSPEWVARHGDKIRFEEACCHFPGGQLEKEKYRE